VPPGTFGSSLVVDEIPLFTELPLRSLLGNQQ
jgi:hypothetical protein